MILFLLIFIIELNPMITLIKWRTNNKKGLTIDISKARHFSRLSYFQLGLLLIKVISYPILATRYPILF